MALQQPLLSDSRPSSEQSDERADAEEYALLNEQRKQAGVQKYGWPFWREVGLFVWATIATAAVIVLAVLYQHLMSSSHDGSGTGTGSPKVTGKRNLIFMVSDGMGPTSLSLTRSYRQFESGLPINDVLVLDQHLIGSSRTRSSSSLITDSAAGATAFSCGMKSYNGAISILPDHSACGTVLEAAKKAGYMTGLVVTTRITDATPACFAAHVNMRGEEDRIAEQEVGNHPLGRVVDLIFGGGRCHFLPNTTDGSCRADGTDVVEMAKSNGFGYASTREEFNRLKLDSSVKLPFLGLFAEKDIPYEVDRRQIEDQYPSLDEMADLALKTLTKATEGSDKGFFLMIEGSRIDHAGHANDPVAQVHEVLAYDKAFSTVLKFLDDGDVPGVVVSTSDHETGGLATARQLHESYPEYLWYPGVLANSSHSAENLAMQLDEFLDPETPGNSASLRSFVNDTLAGAGLGIHDASDAELDEIVDHPKGSAYAFADMISRRSQVGWSTHGHSGKFSYLLRLGIQQNTDDSVAVDVNIYGTAGSEVLKGNHENTEVGEFIRDYLDLDLEAITAELKSKGAVMKATSADGKAIPWTGVPLDESKRLDKLDCYHGDFKHKH